MGQTTGRITLWGVEVFVATAQEGSVSAAARRLGASNSAVSQQLTGLEGALGSVLMDRSTRPVSLTPSGKIFLRRAANILAEAQRAKVELAGEDFSALPNFRLGVIEDFDADVTPRLLADMAQDLTNCQFLLETGASHTLCEQLEARALDVAVSAEIGAKIDQAEVHPLMVEPFVAVVPNTVRSENVSLTDLAELPFIMYSERQAMGRQITRHLSEQNVNLRHQFQMDSYHAIMAMVADGRGWAIITPLGFLRAQRFHAQTRVVPLPMAPLTRQISVMARRDVLGGMPQQIAGLLRPLLEEMIVKPTVQSMPWLAREMRVITPPDFA